LTAAERQDLATWLQLNAAALKARHDGAEQLRLAEQALRQGRHQEALAYLREAGTNQQFLTAGDRQRLQQLGEQLRPGLGLPAPAGGAGGGAWRRDSENRGAAGFSVDTEAGRC
jgi:hypothetical protein